MTWLFGLVVMGAAGSHARAQSAFWFDTRNGGVHPGSDPTPGAVDPWQDISAPVYPFTNGQDTPGAFNGGSRGDGQILRITPTTGTDFQTAIPTFYPNFDDDGDTSTGDFYLYIDMLDDPSGMGDVLTSVGLDIEITGADVPGGIESVSFEVINDQSAFGDVSVVGGAGPWDTVDPGHQMPGNPPSWVGIKTTLSPFDGGGMYNSSLGLEPGGPYRFGRLRVQGAFRDCNFAAGHAAARMYQVRLVVNDGLITRSYNPATPGDAIEDVQFGYTAGVLDPAISGSDVGATSANPDAEIHVRFKCDGNGDGRYVGSDIGVFVAARSACATGPNAHTQLLASLFDASGDRRVLNNDIPGTIAARVETYNAAASCTP